MLRKLYGTFITLYIYRMDNNNNDREIKIIRAKSTYKNIWTDIKKKNEKSNSTPDYPKYIKKNNAIQFVKGMEVDELPMKLIVTSIMRRPRGRQNDSVNKLSVEKQRVEWGSTY